jgi:aminopeptidase N
MKKINIWLCALCFVITSTCIAQTEEKKFTHADTLRGSVTPERAWWDVLRYDIEVKPDYENKTILGSNTIEFRTKMYPETPVIQIDLQEPLMIDSVIAFDKLRLDNYKREGNVYFITLPKERKELHLVKVKIYYHGKPREAVRPPWEGGWIFTKDKMGRPWMSIACQGLGASVWYPCKDYQGDEPNNGASLTITVADSLVAVGNGRLKEKKMNNDGTATYKWEVQDPINNYDIIPYIGKYVTWHEDFNGEKGKLDCDYWVLDYNLDKAKKQFVQADSMLRCFEYWMGPYPFYEDGYKLVEAPHLGMEHQSAVAYGNKFENGYLGEDLSATGWGLKWDFIIVHESGHEWFGNNITTKDLADMWVHEGFTNYSETLYTDCQDGVKAGNEYCIGTRKRIKNDKPIIAHYGVNEKGSNDMYYKGGNMLHTIRQIINNDSVFRQIWRGLNKEFYHQTVTTIQIEEYISTHAKKDFSKVFNQYLRTTKIPELEYKTSSVDFSYRWANCVPGFNMPVKLIGRKKQWLQPTEQWQTIKIKDLENFEVDENFYINLKKAD